MKITLAAASLEVGNECLITVTDMPAKLGKDPKWTLTPTLADATGEAVEGEALSSFECVGQGSNTAYRVRPRFGRPPS